MARQPELVTMDIGSNRLINISVPYKIIEYFGIVSGGVAVAQPYLRKRKPYIRKVRSSTLNDTIVKTISVEGAEWQDIRTPSTQGVMGKLIKIPTQLHAIAGDPTSPIRLVSMRIPSIATNYVIAMWINQRFVSKKPTYYITSSGGKYPVNVANVVDPNPGNDAPAAV